MPTTPGLKLSDIIANRIVASGLDLVLGSDDLIYLQPPGVMETLAVIHRQMRHNDFKMVAHIGTFVDGKPNMATLFPLAGGLDKPLDEFANPPQTSSGYLACCKPVAYGDNEAVQTALANVDKLLAQVAMPMGPFMPCYINGFPRDDNAILELERIGFVFGDLLRGKQHNSDRTAWRYAKLPPGWSKRLFSEIHPIYGRHVWLLDDRGRLRAHIFGEWSDNVPRAEFRGRFTIIPGVKEAKIIDRDCLPEEQDRLVADFVPGSFSNETPAYFAEKYLDQLLGYPVTPLKGWGEELEFPPAATVYQR